VHFTELRTRVLSAFPRLYRQDVEATGDDFDALVHLIQRHSGLSASEVHNRLRQIEVLEVDGDIETREPSGDANGGGASVERQLRLGFGFEESERSRVVDMLRKLNRQLQRFPADATDVELNVKDRETMTQKVTMEVKLPHFPRIVATSNELSLRDALMDVREEVLRQVKEQHARRRG
jgi:hypothetical protein